MPGVGELLIILAIVVVIFGATKLPAVGDALGRMLRNFKRGVSGDDEIEVGATRPRQLSAESAADRRRP